VGFCLPYRTHRLLYLITNQEFVKEKKYFEASPEVGISTPPRQVLPICDNSNTFLCDIRTTPCKLPAMTWKDIAPVPT
jgi:hypothetical protein